MSNFSDVVSNNSSYSITDKHLLQYSYFHQIQNKYQKSETIQFDQI